MATVLVVDDSKVDRRLAGGLLQKASHLDVMYASHGHEALQMMERDCPDLVVTDLQMPEMNGLELVEAVRHRFPLVPVVLMTAFGSEEIAVEALERGAASYVPKTKLAEKLVDIVDGVLAMARADRSHDRLLDHLSHVEFNFVLENDSALVPPLVDFFQHNVSNLGLCDETGRIRVGIALEEALLNALYHGNLEISSEALLEASSRLLRGDAPTMLEERRGQLPYRDRRLHVHADISGEEARFVIRDEGPGFDPGRIPDPTNPENLERECGRGLLLMRSFMDEVSYNTVGNEVTLVKRADVQPNAA
jgi:CheY-like chemotaxis protein